MDYEIEVVINANCKIGEGPVWDGDNNIVYWVDLLGNRIYSYSVPEKKVDNIDVGQNIGSIALRNKGGVIAALQNGFYFVDMEEKNIEQITDPESDKSNNRFNDGKCDCKGRFWAGTMSKNLDSGYGDYDRDGSLYCLTPDYNVEKKIEEVILSNGIDWSPDCGKMYYIDTGTEAVVSYDFFPETGAIKNKKEIISLKNKSMGLPDGMSVDSEGMVWIALWGGGCLSRWNPETGRLLQKIDLPVRHVTSCVFGGANLDEIYVTTANLDTDLKKYPQAGALFRIKADIQGLPTNKYFG